MFYLAVCLDLWSFIFQKYDNISVSSLLFIQKQYHFTKGIHFRNIYSSGVQENNKDGMNQLPMDYN